MEAHLGAEMVGEHLRAEADAQERLLLLQRDADPFGLAADELVLVVGAHRPAEDDRAAVVRQRLGQRIAVARLADIESVAVAAEPLADVAWIGLLLMQHDADGLLRLGRGAVAQAWNR